MPHLPAGSFQEAGHRGGGSLLLGLGALGQHQAGLARAREHHVQRAARERLQRCAGSAATDAGSLCG